MSELWELVWGKSNVDPAALFNAIEKELNDEPLDFRTRLLIHESTHALEQYWGYQRLLKRLEASPVRAKIQAIQKEKFDDLGFPQLKEQLMERTGPETVKEFLRELGSRIHESTTLDIGGSIALILTGYLSRATTDIDVVDEVPAPIRDERELLKELQDRYRLLLTHFESHYLPTGWKDRLQYLGEYGTLKIYAVNVYDIFLGKLFSTRAKDLDDLRAIKPHIDKEQLSKQLLATTGTLSKEPSLKQTAEKNWYVLFGENLPE